MVDQVPLLADNTLTGSAWCQAHSLLVDNWLVAVLEGAVAGDLDGVALVAVGGYGRSELCPQSDIDVMLVHDRRSDIAAVADHVWYPIWDEGLHLGHSVCTVGEALELAANDLDTATALLSARHVAGDASLSEQLAKHGHEQWHRRSNRSLTQLATRVQQRHDSAGEVAFLLEPDLKEGRGGLRDVHSLHWAEAADRVLIDDDRASLSSAYGVLLDARVELQRLTGRPTNIMAVQEQAAVASALGDAGPDDLMARIAASARAISWTSDDTWRRVSTRGRRSFGRTRRPKTLDTGIALVDGEVLIDDDAPLSADPTLALRVAAHAARRGATIERRSLERLAASAPTMPDRWETGACALLVDLLLQGTFAIRVIEALDQRGVWTKILPEWEPVRARPQHNAYHRFTVDRHLLETAANAARLAPRVPRPDLLVLAALLHDIGKGYPGDHTSVGMELVDRIATRLALPRDDVDTLVALVEHHLLLADVASRRDLDDPATIDRVAATIGSGLRLALLAALTEADSRATSPAAWGPWKAQLVAQLVDRVGQVLDGAPVTGTSAGPFPTAEQLSRLASGGRHIDASGDVLTVITDDRPGVFSRVAGVLALNGLEVLAAAAYSDAVGRALGEFHVVDPLRNEPPWNKVVADLDLALDGRLALHARVAERARTYGRSKPAARNVNASVTFDYDASTDATVIDVHATDAVGVLYRITRALAELDLDIRSARVQTLGTQVVDAFYVRDRHGNKITDRHDLGEIERSILHSLRE